MAGRWRSYDYDDLLKRDKLSLGPFWIRDESLTDTDSLPPSQVIASRSLMTSKRPWRGSRRSWHGWNERIRLTIELGATAPFRTDRQVLRGLGTAIPRRQPARASSALGRKTVSPEPPFSPGPEERNRAQSL